ncbi:MAG: 2,3-diaminopropionate biosynthesis protein SbnB [Tatlockia sp.]|nr:2,3-diaminopropionate biosynthesis protein SbnB [Tatlockia sp.]
MDFSFSVISGERVYQCIQSHRAELFQIIKKTYRNHSLGKTINPNSYFLKFPSKPNARIIALPAAIDAQEKISGIKWISSYPDNIKEGFPRASALILLNDFQTGYPIACLEGSIISATRTAYSAVLAAELLHTSPKSIDSLGLIGNGLIAKYIYECLINNQWEIKKIYLHDLDKQSSEGLKKSIQASFGGVIEIVDSHELVIEKSELVTLTTTAPEPYIVNPALFNKSQTILNISLRDLSPEIMMNANNVVDDIDHVLCANTSPHLTFNAYKTKDFIQGTLGDYLLNPFQLDREKPVIFSPMGLGILDLAISYFIYEKEKNHHLIDDFFYELSRHQKE